MQASTGGQRAAAALLSLGKDPDAVDDAPRTRRATSSQANDYNEGYYEQRFSNIVPALPWSSKTMAGKRIMSLLDALQPGQYVPDHVVEIHFDHLVRSHPTSVHRYLRAIGHRYRD